MARRILALVVVFCLLAPATRADGPPHADEPPITLMPFDERTW